MSQPATGPEDDGYIGYMLSDVARLCADLPVRILNVGTIAALTQVHALNEAVQMLASCDLSQEQAIMFVCNDACTVPATGVQFAAMVWDRTRWVYADSLADPGLCWPAAKRAAKRTATTVRVNPDARTMSARQNGERATRAEGAAAGEDPRLSP